MLILLEERDLPDPGALKAGKICVADHATSLNFHDLLVASGGIPTADVADIDVRCRRCS